VAGLALLVALGSLFFLRQSLETRTKRVMGAIIGSDMKTVIDLGVPGTELDIMRWYQVTYQRYLDLKLAMGGIDAGVTINILSDGSNGPAVVVGQFSAEGTRLGGAGITDTFQPNPSLANTKSMVEVHLYWVKDIWGNWLLDGKRTAEGIP
jgi:hypothetical protein